MGTERFLGNLSYQKKKKMFTFNICGQQKNSFSHHKNGKLNKKKLMLKYQKRIVIYKSLKTLKNSKVLRMLGFFN